MICAVCGKLVGDDNKKRLYIQAKWYTVHKECLRRTTKEKLIEKGLIKGNLKVKIEGNPEWVDDNRK